jgi:tRNA threonylcarbamoyladenosine biosynthesis protein TsaB
VILLLDTSTPTCKISLINGAERFDNEWQADRDLAGGLLGYIGDSLRRINVTWSDIKGIGVFEGPGSFTGLRIGLTVANTIADSQQISIVGGRGEEWQTDVLGALNSNRNDKIVMPFYGSEAHITAPRK